MLAGDLRLIGIIGLVSMALWCVMSVPEGHVSDWMQPGNGTDPDFPGFRGNITNISSCSYLIPMDYTYQGCGNESDPEIGMIYSACDTCTVFSGAVADINKAGSEVCLSNETKDFNLFAYGLVNYLLWHDIPVKWIIKTNKTHDGYDLENVATALIYPTRILNRTRSAPQAVRESSQLRSFKGGPFIIQTVYTSFADVHISYYTLNIGEVRVYATRDSILADVRYTLLSRPFVAVLASSGQQYILEATLLSAGFERDKHFKTMTKEEAKKQLGEGVCITMAMEPHFHSSSDQDLDAFYTNNSASFVSAARIFLNYGSNLLAMCGGINTYEQCDNEDGTYCYQCFDKAFNQRAPFIQSCSFCSNGTVGVNTSTPCYGPWDRASPNCTGGNNVGIIPFGASRGGWLMSGNTGISHARSYPVVKGYCPDGFFISESVSDPQNGGFHTPARSAPSVGLDIPNNYTSFVDMSPDIPFNQYEGKWEYESRSSVRFMSLWHQSDGIPADQQTKLRALNGAHWTIAEINENRDLKTGAGYPYGVYYTAHAKLPQFQGGKGGNIFYIAGHYYSFSNNATTADYDKVGYKIFNDTGFAGAPCVDAGPARVYNDSNGTLLSYPATPRGGGCFNRPGRRLLMNAVLTPSNLTCNAEIKLCVNGKCTLVKDSVVLDPCKAYGVCVSSSFKKRGILVAAFNETDTNSTVANSTCAPRLRCSCDLYIDCCTVCGGDNSTCYDTPPESPIAYSPPTSVTVDGKNLTAFTGKLPPVPLPPLSGGHKSSPMDRRAIVALLAVSNLEPSIWTSWLGKNIPTITPFSLDGPVTLVLDQAPANVTAFLEDILKVITSLGSIESDRIQLNYTSPPPSVIIRIDSYDFPPPVIAPAEIPNINVTNITSPISGESGNVLEPGTCRFYTFTVGSNIYKVLIYVSIQSVSPNQSLQVVLQKDTVPDLTNYLCNSPVIKDNNEYTFSWVNTASDKGNFRGSSVDFPPALRCKSDVPITGTWFATLCANSSKLTFSYEVSLLQLPNANPVTPTISLANSLHPYFNILLLLCTYLFVLLCR